jgi:nicotinamidase-related amidase
MDRTLVIVDMQSSFEIPLPIAANLNQICIARQRGWPVIVVLMRKAGALQRQLKNALAGYGRKATVYKDHWSGADEILQAAQKHKFPTRFRVTGIYTECCVYHTVSDLVMEDYPVEVVRGACAPARGFRAFDYLDCGRHNLKLIKNRNETATCGNRKRPA